MKVFSFLGFLPMPFSPSLEEVAGLSMLIKYSYPISPVPSLFKLQSLEIFTDCAVYLPWYNRGKKKGKECTKLKLKYCNVKTLNNNEK